MYFVQKKKWRRLCGKKPEKLRISKKVCFSVILANFGNVFW